MIAVQAAAPAAQALFRPVADRLYRIEQRETRSDDGTVRRFASRRTIVFRRDGAGWVAEATLDALEHDDDEVGRMFAAANAGLLHRTLRVHLDAAGRVTAVDDADAALAALVAGIENIPVADPARQAQRTAMAAAVRGLAPAARQALFASEVAALIETAAAVPGVHPVTLPGRPPFAARPLSGTQTTSLDPGRATIRVEAGNVAPDGSGLRLSTVRNLDRATGLVTDARTTTEVTIVGSDGRRRVATTERTTTVTLAP